MSDNTDISDYQTQSGWFKSSNIKKRVDDSSTLDLDEHDKQATMAIIERAIYLHDDLLDWVKAVDLEKCFDSDLIEDSMRLINPCKVEPGELSRSVYRELLEGTIDRLTDELKLID